MKFVRPGRRRLTVMEARMRLNLVRNLNLTSVACQSVSQNGGCNCGREESADILRLRLQLELARAEKERVQAEERKVQAKE